MLSTFKVRPQRRACHPDPVLDCPPPDSQAGKGQIYRLVLPSAGPLESVPLRQEVAKPVLEIEASCAGCFHAFLRDWKYRVHTVLYFIRRLAEHTLRGCEMHAAAPAAHTQTSSLRRRVPLAGQELSRPVCLKQEREGAPFSF